MELKKVGLRAFSGIIYCGIIIGCIFWGATGVFLLACLLSTLACIEFAKICHDVNPKRMPALILDVLGCICLSTAYFGLPLVLWLLVFTARLVLELYLKEDTPIHSLAISMMSQLYIGVPMAIMAFTGAVLNPMILLAIFFLIWINDTGAFVVGSLCGRHKLFERISPKKTWEGFLGGFIFCIAASLIFCFCCNNFFGMERLHATWAAWIALGAIVSIFGTWGDLVESMMKRSLKIKDSGNIIPGHGGILDRIDSLLLVLPACAVFYLLALML